MYVYWLTFVKDWTGIYFYNHKLKLCYAIKKNYLIVVYPFIYG